MAKQHDKMDWDSDRLDWDSGCMDFCETISYIWGRDDFDKWANHIYSDAKQQYKENWEICLEGSIRRGILDECKKINNMLKPLDLRTKADKLYNLICQFADDNGSDSQDCRHFYKRQLRNRIDEILNSNNANIMLVLFALKRFIEQISSIINISHCNNRLKDNSAFKSLLAFRYIRESLAKEYK